MERFVTLTAPTGRFDFVFKLLIAMLIGGTLNHLRHVLVHGYPGEKSFWMNFLDASFTTLPMCAFALLLIAHLNSLQNRLYIQATRDALTDLPNRRWFMSNTPDMIQSSQALMIIDIDNFKQINDRFGHDTGDKCLQGMAQHLRDCLGTEHRYARIGGEEFAVFFQNADSGVLKIIAAQISSGFAFDTGDQASELITSSVGIALNSQAQSRAEALKLADQAVYRAKSDGRACYAVFLDQAA